MFTVGVTRRAWVKGPQRPPTTALFGKGHLLGSSHSTTPRELTVQQCVGGLLYPTLSNNDDLLPVCARAAHIKSGLTMSRLDTIRSRARHAAWKSQDGINYNPFARTMSRTKSPDPEEPPVVPDSHSETCVSPTAETERHNQAENEAFAGPKRWRTSPPNSATTSHPLETPDAAPILEKEAEPSARSGEALLTSKNQRPDNLRKRFKIFPGKKENSEESVERTTTSASRSSKKPKKITLMSQFKVVFLRWINILLIAVPVGIALKFAHVDGKIVFTVNFIAIIPLAGILSYATEELALRVGETLGGLLNASFG